LGVGCRSGTGRLCCSCTSSSSKSGSRAVRGDSAPEDGLEVVVVVVEGSAVGAVVAAVGSVGGFSLDLSAMMVELVIDDWCEEKRAG